LQPYNFRRIVHALSAAVKKREREGAGEVFGVCAREAIGVV
jgi:hypothetical protein